MGRKPDREQLVAAIGADISDRQAIERAIAWLPDRVLVEYLGKLKHPGQRPGTLHELRVVGKLLRLGSSRLSVHPPTKHENFDAVLEIEGTELELEITAEVEPSFERSIRAVCDRLASRLAERHPGKDFHVRLAADEDSLAV